MSELNLIPSSLKSSRNKRNKNQNIIYSIIIILAIMFFGVYFPGMQLNRLQNDEASYKSQVDAQINVIQERDRMVNFVNTTNELISKVENFNKSRVLVYSLITQLQKLTPADVSLNSLAYTMDGISISAVAKNYFSPSIFVGNLQESELYKNAKLTNINKDQTNTYSFNVTIKLK